MTLRARQEIALVLAAVAAYELGRRLIHPDAAAALQHAHAVLRLERTLGVAWERPVQRAFAPAQPVLGAVYLVAQFVVTGVFFVWLYRRAAEGYVRWRNGFLVATALALVVHWRFPVAPPRLAGVGIADTLHLGPAASLTDPFAAMPSLHAAWALGVGVGLCLYARSRAWRFVGAAYPVLVVLATIVTGNHFLLDAVAGGAVLGAGFRAAGVLRSRSGATLSPATRGGAVR